MAGIIGVDVGKTSGVAWGIFNPALRDKVGIWHALARGRGIGWAEIPMGTKERGLAVSVAVMEKIADWNLKGMDLRDISIIIEDFSVRKDLRGGTGRDKLAPVFVAGKLEGTLQASGFGQHVIYVPAATSKKFATDERLKRWARTGGVKGRAGWVRGKPHARDAWRLVAVGLERTV